MAINFTWNIKQVDVYPTLEENTNVIYNVHWELKAEDSEHQTFRYFRLIWFYRF